MSEETRHPTPFDRAKADIAALKNWEALPEAKKQFARQNGLDWKGYGHRYYAFMNRAERTEADIASLKNWQALPEDRKLFAMQHMVNWEGVHGGAYHDLMRREIDFTKVTPETQREITGKIWHGFTHEDHLRQRLMSNPAHRAYFQHRDPDRGLDR